MKKILSRLRCAVDNYNMIDENDKIAVGVSGGKDSLVALLAMKTLQRFYPKKFEVEAFTIDLGFPDMDYSPIAKLCEEMQIPYTIEKTDIKRLFLI
jgi:tRNA(Ile)-lysidine synthase TilS/MesJ